MTPAEKQIAQLYIGYFRRAPDPSGLAFWVAQLNAGAALLDIAYSFSQTGEYAALYGGLSNQALINTIYANMFHRVPDPAGNDYWLNQLNSGVPSARLIVDVIYGAQNNDRLMLENAATVAMAWMRGAPEPFDIAAARLAVSSINNWITPAGANVTIIAPELLPRAGELVAAIAAGWAQWGVTHVGIDIEVRYQPGGHINDTGLTKVLAVCLPRMEVDAGTGWTASGVEYEAETGKDPNGRMCDLVITIMADIDWLLDNYRGDVLAGLMAHECGHAFFREGWSTSYMQLISFASGAPHFIGPQAMALHGGPVPLFAANNYVHAAIPDSVMWPYVSQYAANRVTPLDLAMLRDMGISTG